MYTMFSLWVRSHSDLPLKTFQIVNTFRYETKQTRSFIRVREIHFFEAHTVHKDEKGATEQISEDATMVQRFCTTYVFQPCLQEACLGHISRHGTLWRHLVMPNGRTFLQLLTITGINGLGPSISSMRIKTRESVLPSDHIWHVREVARVIGWNAWRR